MKSYRKSCWLLLWDQSRVVHRDDLNHLLFPRFVGTLPSQMSATSVANVLPALLLSHAPVTISAKVECGKFLRRGKPRVKHCKDFPSDRITCAFGRLILVAFKVRGLHVFEDGSGDEILEWTEDRRYWADPKDFSAPGEEITPERKQTLRQKKVSLAIG